MRNITKQHIEDFRLYLINEEKSGATIEKYMRDIQALSAWLGDRAFDKVDVLTYKAELTKKYAPASVNTVLSSLNSFFTYQEWYELKTKTLKIQRQIFASDEKELTKAEYDRIVGFAENIGIANAFIQEGEAASESFIPSFDCDGV